MILLESPTALGLCYSCFVYLEAQVPVLRFEPSSVQINPPVCRQKAVLYWACRDRSLMLAANLVHLRNTDSESKLPSSSFSPVNESDLCHLGKTPEINSLKELSWHVASQVPSMVAWTCGIRPLEAQHILEGQCGRRGCYLRQSGSKRERVKEPDPNITFKGKSPAA